MTIKHEEAKGSHTARRSRKGAWAVALAVPVGVVASGALVWNASYAAFTAQTDNSGNTWQSGQVSITDNDEGVAFWSLENEGYLAPGDTGTKCITVTYAGNVQADIVFDVSGTATNTFGEALDFKVDLLQGAPQEGITYDLANEISEDCIYSGSGVISPTNLYNADLTGLLANGDIDPSFPAAPGSTRTYQITWTVTEGSEAEALSDAQEDETANASFVWTANSVPTP